MNLADGSYPLTYPIPLMVYEEAQMDLSNLIYRVTTDEKFSSQFKADPERTIEKLGFQVTQDELTSLLSVLSVFRKDRFTGPQSYGWR